MHKKAIQPLYRTFKDLKETERFFSGTLILFSGNFRQILQMIPHSTPADELNAFINHRFYGNNVRKLILTTNIHVQLQHVVSAERFVKQ